MDVKKIYLLVVVLVFVVIVNLFMEFREDVFIASSRLRNPALQPLGIIKNTSWPLQPRRVKAIPIDTIKKLKLNTKDKIIKRYNDRRKDHEPSWSHDSVCKFPDFNPFASEGMRAWQIKTKEPCTKMKIGKIVDNRFVVEDPSGKISLVTMDYILRGRQRKANGTFDPPRGPTNIINDEKYTYTSVLNDDFHVHFTMKYKVNYNADRKAFVSSLLEHDFFRAVITMKAGPSSTEYHAAISNRTETCNKHGKPFTETKKNEQSKSGLPYNVHMFMVDAISQGNMYRQTPRLAEMLENDIDAMVFKAHGIHGDGTTSQLMATLAGYVYNQDVTSPWQPPSKESCDSINLIFKDFKNAGYTTLYNEDFVLGSTFNYKMNGFDKPPVDWYPRPFWIAAHERTNGCGIPPCVCEDQELIRFLKTFTTVCEQEKKFSFQVSSNAHDDMNWLVHLEDDIIDLYEFFKEKSRVENTIFILFGDHGARWGGGSFRNTKQGRLEEYNPFYSIVLPPEFKYKYRELYENMRANTEELTSHFDVHWTLKHILSYPKIEKPNLGQSLFTKIDPTKRTCQQTGIPSKYCFCLKTEKISANTDQAKTIAQKAIEYMNNKTAAHPEPKELCAKLTLKRIIDLEYATDTTKNEGVFYIMFQVLPSDATFDIRVKKDLTKNTLYVDPEISRTSLYGNQPACIQLKHPKLAPFCYCKSLLNGSSSSFLSKFI